MRGSKYTHALLAPIVAASRSFSGVMRQLGLRPTGGNYRMIAGRIRFLGLDTDHFAYGRYGDRFRALSADELAPVVASVHTIAQVAAQLDMPQKGRGHHELAARIRALGLDTSHFRGRGWSRGETAATHPSVARTAKAHTFSDDEVFVENSPVQCGPRLRNRLLALGWKYECAWCGIDAWRGEKLVLHLDHINGNPNDNRLENLRFLCPNCHSQTPTYSNHRRS